MALKAVNYNELSQRERKHVRENYAKDQDGLCFYCDAPLDGPASERVQKKVVNKNLFPKGFFNHPVHLHHNHNTGMTIGAVHCKCNAVLWQYHHE